MHRGVIFLLFVAIGLIVASPILVFAAWMVRGRRDSTADDGPPESAVDPRAGSRRSAVAGSLVALVVVVLLGGAWYLSGASIDGSASGNASMTPGMQMPGDPMPGMSMGEVPEGGVSLPPSLSGLPMTRSATGSEALRQVEQMHLGDFPMASAAIATYGDGTVQVWVATAGNGATATQLTARMADAISAGGSPFASPRPLSGEPDVWQTRGMGQVHYFWAQSDQVWWVSAERSLAAETLAELRGEAGA